MTAAYYLAKKGHNVDLIEKEGFLGGLAQGFKTPEWDWYLERAYHHLFSNDSKILDLARETGFNGIFFQSPLTASLYNIHNNYRIFPLDTPQDLLRFPLLSPVERIRAGMALARLKFLPFSKRYEELPAQEYLEKQMGQHAYETLFGELFRKKFGKYAEKILTSFIWARITKRTKQLGYIEGGFQSFIDYLEKTDREVGVNVRKKTELKQVSKKGKGFELVIKEGEGSEKREHFDVVISTLPTTLLAKVGENIFPAYFPHNLRKLQYLHAVVLILESPKKILDKTYWLNICVPELPAMLVAQHTNLVDTSHYGGKHLIYTANYVDREDPLVAMPEKEVLAHYLKQLKKINRDFDGTYSNYFVFKAPFAQPIFDKTFLTYKPDFITPVKNFYVANLDMTYPYDRGTNYAVKLGKEVANLI